MGNKLYVGNLAFDVNTAALQQLFSRHGTVTSTEIISDRITRESKGFGFVQMGTEPEAQAAVEALNGSSFQGRKLTVNMAKPLQERLGANGIRRRH